MFIYSYRRKSRRHADLLEVNREQLIRSEEGFLQQPLQEAIQLGSGLYTQVG